MSASLPEYTLNRRRFLTTLLAGSTVLALGDLALPRVTRAAGGSGSFTLPPLPWPEDALSPAISANTIGFYYGKHHQGYVNNLNQKSFGDYDKFRAEFAKAATSQFGSGWAWLVKDGDNLTVTKTGDVDTPIAHGQQPLLTIDVWEHAILSGLPEPAGRLRGRCAGQPDQLGLCRAESDGLNRGPRGRRRFRRFSGTRPGAYPAPRTPELPRFGGFAYRLFLLKPTEHTQ